MLDFTVGGGVDNDECVPLDEYVSPPVLLTLFPSNTCRDTNMRAQRRHSHPTTPPQTDDKLSAKIPLGSAESGPNLTRHGHSPLAITAPVILIG